jgi:hypothetical protein
MKILVNSPLLIFSFQVLLLVAVIIKNINHWHGFFINLPGYFIASGIILFLSVKTRGEAKKVKPVENEEIFDHLFLDKKITSVQLRRSAGYVNRYDH